MDMDGSLIEDVIPVWNFSGPTNLNTFLHSIPHCTFEHGCGLPFTDAPEEMVEFHRGDMGARWMESLMMIGFIPLAVFLLYLIIDCIVRWCRYCRRGSKGGATPGVCCCCPCGSSVDSDDSNLSESDRVSTFGSRTYGAFPDALPVEPKANSSSLLNPKRGGVAGQTADAFHPAPRNGASSAVDVDNPFHTSSRLVSVARVDPLLDETEISRPANPDKRYESRMLAALILAVCALTLLSVSIGFSQSYADSWDSIHGNLDEVHSFIQFNIEDGVEATQADATNTQQGLTNLLAAGMASSQPFSPDWQSRISTLSASYNELANSGLQPFADEVSSQTRRITTVRNWMDDAEKVREDTTYALLAVTMFFAVVVIIVHVYYRQREATSLCSKTLFALLIGGTCFVWSVGLLVSIGASDVCQDPITYAHAAFNSSYVRENRGVDQTTIETAQFYINCVQTPNVTSAVNNPLTQLYYDPLVSTLNSAGGLSAQLSEVIDYIQSNRTDLIQYATLLTSLSSSTTNDVSSIGSSLGCETVHVSMMHAIDHACVGVTKNLFIATTLQFFGCILLMFVLCLSLMRRRRTVEFDEDDDPPFEAHHRSEDSGMARIQSTGVTQSPANYNQGSMNFV